MDDGPPHRLTRQMSLDLRRRTHGGARVGAGRPPMTPGERRGGVAHRKRASHRKGDPVHVTLRVRRRVPSLRSELLQSVVKRALLKQRKDLADRSATHFQLVHFSIQDDHVHLIVEAQDKRGLARGVAGLEIRIARRVNALLGRKGAFWSGRYHRHDLRSPAETRNALRYVLLNTQKDHRVLGSCAFADPHSSAPTFDGFSRAAAVFDDEDLWPTVAARTWLLGKGWRRHGLIDPAARSPSSAHHA